MGKLSIEEKAKAYDEALKRAKILYNDKNEIGYANAESVLEEVFPLLKESKDERIRKEIINYFAKGKEYLSLCSIGKDDILAWLEKQAEQKPTLRERYKNIAESEWFKKTHNGMSVSNDEEPKWTDDDEKIRKALIEYFNEQCDMSDWNGVYGYQVVAWLEKQELKSNPYSGVSFSYNGNIWGMCARDNGVEILFDGELKAFLSSEKSFIYPTRPQPVLEPIKEEKAGNNNKVETKFKVGDWVVSPNGVYWHIDAIQNGRYEVTTDTGQCGNWPLDTNIYRLWTIQDAKDGDVLASELCDSIILFKGIKDNNIDFYCDYDFSKIDIPGDRFAVNNGQHYGSVEDSKDFHPATKEQCDLLFQKMYEAGYEWDAEKKELKKIEDEEYNGEDYGIDSLFHAQRILEKTLGSVDGYQTDDGILSHQCAITAVKKLYEQKPKRMISAEAKEAMYDKPDWSEKDENVLEDIEEAIINYWHGDTQDILLDWLKSLRPQNHWKPSKEQMKAIEHICDGNYNVDLDILDSIYRDFKKLREE